tara:strand:- start:77 stop:433 length:357 start_codon:yes stop_codon:yes gene_type:complete
MKINEIKSMLLGFIKLISNGNHQVVAGKGILIRKQDINHSLLSEHRDEIGGLCVQLGLKMNHNADQFETKSEPNFDDGGTFIGMIDVESYKTNAKGYEMKESIWFGKAQSDDDALAVL